MSLASTHTYETVYILKSSLSDDDSSAIHTKVDSVIQKFDGAVKQRDDWGLRDLAYNIDDETMGRFNIVVYNGKAGVVEEIERHFKISPDVIRFITVAVETDYEYGQVKKQMVTAEEEMKKNRELRKKNQ